MTAFTKMYPPGDEIPIPAGMIHPDTEIHWERKTGYDIILLQAKRDIQPGGVTRQLVRSQREISGFDLHKLSRGDILEYVHRTVQQLDREIDVAVKGYPDFASPRDERDAMSGLHPVQTGPRLIQGVHDEMILVEGESDTIYGHGNPITQHKCTPKFNYKEIQPKMSNFNQHTVYLTADQENRARSGEMKRKEALDCITEGFLPEIVLAVGNIITYEDTKSNEYEIVRIEGDDMIVRRLVANNGGPAGETHEASVASYVTAIREGRASIVLEDDAE